MGIHCTSDGCRLSADAIKPIRAVDIARDPEPPTDPEIIHVYGLQDPAKEPRQGDLVVIPGFSDIPQVPLCQRCSGQDEWAGCVGICLATEDAPDGRLHCTVRIHGVASVRASEIINAGTPVVASDARGCEGQVARAYIRSKPHAASESPYRIIGVALGDGGPGDVIPIALRGWGGY